jgi:hypothetical protein
MQIPVLFKRGVILANILVFLFSGFGWCSLPNSMDNPKPKTSERRSSLSTDPLLPIFSSFALLYEHPFTQQDAVLLGFWYGKATETYPKMLKYPGHIQNYAPILAYRRYFWRGLHAEYQLYPGYSIFHEEAKNKNTHSFTLFTEFRAGYRFDFSIGKLPLMLNLQWPIGFTLYESNQPESFREINRQDPVFYIFWPNIYVGVRF